MKVGDFLPDTPAEYQAGYGEYVTVNVDKWDMALINDIVEKVLINDARHAVGTGKTVEIRATYLDGRDIGDVPTPMLAWHTNDSILESEPHIVSKPLDYDDVGCLYCGRVSTDIPLSGATSKFLREKGE